MTNEATSMGWLAGTTQTAGIVGGKLMAFPGQMKGLQICVPYDMYRGKNRRERYDYPFASCVIISFQLCIEGDICDHLS